jgi:uncharacterized protein YbjT (DUF2867 family)
MTTVVTGATGFLGSALVTELVKRQQSVRILVRDEKKARQQSGDTASRRFDLDEDESIAGILILKHRYLACNCYHMRAPARGA